MNPVIMASGGVDSFLAACLYPDSPIVYVNYGQKYDPLERKAVVDLFGARVTIVNISGLAPLGLEIHVPARNMMLATIGLRFRDEVCFAGMRDEQCPDKNEETFADMSEILSVHCKRKVRIFSPFWDQIKSDAVRNYLNQGGNPEELKRTVSCFEGTESHCRNCEACFRRYICLKVNGVDTPRPQEEIIRNYGLKKLHQFVQRRRLTIIEALGKERFIKINIDESPNLAELRSVGFGPNAYVIGYSSLPKSKMTIVNTLLRQEGVKFDALLMETKPNFFEKNWRKDFNVE